MPPKGNKSGHSELNFTMKKYAVVVVVFFFLICVHRLWDSHIILQCIARDRRRRYVNVFLTPNVEKRKLKKKI